MTKLMSVEHLRDVATSGCPAETGRLNTVPVLRWTIDEATGRAVSHWVLAERQPATTSSATGGEAPTP